MDKILDTQLTDWEEEIINLPHHVSTHHPQMSMYQRAAQFAPFAALNGHEEAIVNTATAHAKNEERRTKLEEM